MCIWDVHHLAKAGLCLSCNGSKISRVVRHLHDTEARTLPVEHFMSGFLEDNLWKSARSRHEVEQFLRWGHRG